eukprot:134658-Pleurochrysis_carterae.AAC.2
MRPGWLVISEHACKSGPVHVQLRIHTLFWPHQSRCALSLLDMSSSLWKRRTVISDCRRLGWPWHQTYLGHSRDAAGDCARLCSAWLVETRLQGRGCVAIARQLQLCLESYRDNPGMFRVVRAKTGQSSVCESTH